MPEDIKLNEKNTGEKQVDTREVKVDETLEKQVDTDGPDTASECAEKLPPPKDTSLSKTKAFVVTIEEKNGMKVGHGLITLEQYEDRKSKMTSAPEPMMYDAIIHLGEDIKEDTKAVRIASKVMEMFAAMQQQNKGKIITSRNP